MTVSHSAGSHHVDRLHHHRTKVHEASAHLTHTIQDAVTKHYAERATAGPDQPPVPPTGPDTVTGPQSS